MTDKNALEPVAFPLIDCDEEMGRFYIPVHPGWEIQTKGNGSLFRIAKRDDSGRRYLVLHEDLHAPLEMMARDIHKSQSDAAEAILQYSIREGELLCENADLRAQLEFFTTSVDDERSLRIRFEQRVVNLRDQLAAMTAERDAARKEAEQFASNLRGKHAVAGATYATVIAENGRFQSRIAELSSLLAATREYVGWTDSEAAVKLLARIDSALHSTPTPDPRDARIKELEAALAGAMKGAERWNAVATLMILGDVELTQDEDGGYSISVEPVENLLLPLFSGNSPEEAIDKFAEKLALEDAALKGGAE